MTDMFVAVDVETANPDLASICQMGAVTFADGQPISTWQSLVDPEDYFDPWNVAIHGITEEAVAGAPNFKALVPEFVPRLAERVVICHTPFDRLAFGRAAEKYSIPPIPCIWLDSAKVVRRAWSQFSCSGYALAKVTAALGITFQHHVAAEDARAAGELIVRAMAHTGLTLSDWLVRVTKPLSGESERIAREGDPDGPLAGEVVVFTGALSLPRREAAKLAAQAGCMVAEGVNEETTLLVVGDQDIRRLAGHKKSSKHRKAEQMISKGQAIRILGEADFQRLIRVSDRVVLRRDSDYA